MVTVVIVQWNTTEWQSNVIWHVDVMDIAYLPGNYWSPLKRWLPFGNLTELAGKSPIFNKNYTCTCTHVGFSFQTCQIFIGGCVWLICSRGGCHAPAFIHSPGRPWYFPVDWVATHHDWKIYNKTKTDRGPKGMPLLNTLNWIVDDLPSFWITCIQAVETWNSLYRFIAFWAHPHRLEVWSIFVWIKYCHTVV